MPALSAALIAGGRSSRMGRDKCLLTFEGEPLWQRQVRTLQKLAADIWVAAPGRPEWCPESMNWAADVAGNAGPMAGLAAGLQTMSGDRLLVLAVDLPEMTADYLEALAAGATEECGVTPEMDGLFQPLSAVYPRIALPIVLAHLEQPDKSLQSLLRELIARGMMRAVEVAESNRGLFRNLNAPTD